MKDVTSGQLIIQKADTYISKQNIEISVINRHNIFILQQGL